MKSSLVIFPFLIIALSTYFLVSCDALPDVVRDTNGDILSSGAFYYIIMPGVHGKDGAITLSSRRNGSCPLDATQSKDGTHKRDLSFFYFTPVDTDTTIVHESTDLNVDTGGESFCGQSMVWKLDRYKGEYVVSTRGLMGNPGAETTLGNWFKIEKYLKHYKLVYCPSVCPKCKAMCKDIGITRKDNSGRLVLNDQPFMVKFKLFAR